MFRLLVFLLLASNSLPSFCQLNDKQFGHYFDLNQNLILDYLDIDYDPSSALNKHHNLTYNYREGYFYNKDGEKIEAEIYGSLFEQSFSYHVPEKKKDQKISVNKCLGLIIDQDSFAVMKNFVVSQSTGNLTITSNRFVHVIDHIPGYTFYKYSDYYLYKKEGEENLKSIPFIKKKFREFCNENFTEFPLIVSQVNEEKINPSNQNEIIRIIDYQKKLNGGLKIYLDKYWNELKDSSNYKFFGKINGETNGLWDITYFDKNGNRVLDGKYSALQNMKKEGVFKWYNKDGNIRKEINFRDNEKVSQKMFYQNGDLHYLLNKNEEENWVYEQVIDASGNSVLDASGNGVEVLFDLANNRSITKTYQSNLVTSSYFVNKEGLKIYQFADKNTDIKSLKSRSEYFAQKLELKPEWVKENINCLVLLKAIINDRGFFEDTEIIYSPIDEINDKIIQAFTESIYSSIPAFKVAKMDNEKVYAEVIIPIDIRTVSFHNTYYYYDWHWLHNQNMMMQMNHISPPQFAPTKF